MSADDKVDRMSIDDNEARTSSAGAAGPPATEELVDEQPEASTSGTSGDNAATLQQPSHIDSPNASAEPATSESASAAIPAKTEPEIRVWKPVAPGTMPKPPDLPESYYTPTPGQLRSAYAGQANQLKKLGVDTNFSSRAQRDKEEREREKKRANRWPKTIVRIRFHDRHQIETTFPSSRTMEHVYKWTKTMLNDETKNEPFILYVPPRIEYKLTDSKVKDKSLLDLQLAPSVVLLVRWQNTILNDSEKLAPIKPELLELATDFPKPPSFDPTPEELAAEEKAKAEAMKEDGDGKDSSGKGKMLGGAKAPKWLKGIGGKK